MDAQFCIICKRPIIGYWHELGKNNVICQSCAAVTTVYDLFQRGIIDIKPDIVETEAVVYQDSLVTKDDGYHYTGEDIAEFGKIISEIKGHGFNNESDFFDECQTLYDSGASDEDNSLLILRKRYQEMVPEPRYEGDKGNDTWDAMYAQWEIASPYFKINPDAIGAEVYVTIGKG